MKLQPVIILLLILVSLSCGRGDVPVRVKGGNVPVVAVAPEEAPLPVRQLLERGKAVVDSVKAPVLGTVAATLVAERPESSLMNFAADALLCRARMYTGENIDIAITNKGGLRSELNEGVVTYGDIYNVFPFDNSIVTLTLDGGQLLRLFGEIASVGGEAVSGARMTIVCDSGALRCGALVVRGCSIPGDDDDWRRSEYRIVTNNYLAQGNDGLSALALGSDKKEYGVTLRELIVDYVSELNGRGLPVTAVKDGRITVVQGD